MKYFYLALLFTTLSVVGYAQNVGINQPNPSNSLHISPVNIGDNPLRIEGIQAYTVNEDSSLIVVNPTTGVIKYMNTSEFSNSIINNSFVTNLGDSLISNSTFISNFGDSLFLSQNFIDSLISSIYNNGDTLLSNNIFITNLGDTLLNSPTFISNLGDTLLSNNTFITNIGDSLLANNIFVSNLGDSLFLTQNFIDSLNAYIFNSGDTLLYNTDFINNLRDSIDTDIDSANLTGLTLNIFENGNSVSVNLTTISDSAINFIINNSDTLFSNSNFVDSIVSVISNNTDSLFSNQSFRDSITSILFSNSDTLLHNSNFINNLRDSINTDNQTLSISGSTLSISNGNSVTLTDNVNDADNNPSNELQTISKSGSIVTLSNSGGSFIDDDTQLTEAQVDAFANNNGYLTSFTEVDGSVTNELQTISKLGSTVTLSNGGGSFTDDNTQLTEAQVDAFANNNGYLTSFTEVDGSITNELQNLSLSGTTLSISSGNNVNLSSFNGDITGVTAGAGLTGGGTSGTPTINAAANNGLAINTGADRIQLGGALTQNTTITQGNFGMIYNLSGSGDFTIQDAGVNHFQVLDNGNTYIGSDTYWRDENTGGTNLMLLLDDGNDGRLLIYENGVTSVDLDANSQFVFNEQGFDRDFRVESNGNANMFRIDAGNNRIGVGISAPTSTIDINGTARVRNIPTATTTAVTPLYTDASGNIVKKNNNIVWVEGTTDVSTSSTTFTDMPNMSTSIVTDANSIIEVNFQTATDNDCTDCWQEFQLIVDGQVKPAGPYNHNAKAIWEQTVNSTSLYNVGAGTHTVKVQWKVGRFGATGTLSNKVATESQFGHVRRLIIKELR